MPLEYAISKETQKLVHVTDVENGLKCACFCPECKDELEARCNVKSKKYTKIPHFSHTNREESRSCLMTQLHLVTQNYLLTLSSLEIPEVSFVYKHQKLTAPSKSIEVNNAVKEYKVGKYFADVMLDTDIGNIFIEITVTSKNTADKVDYYLTNKLPSFEYNFSKNKTLDVKEAISQIATNTANSNWIYEWCRESLIKGYYAKKREQELFAQKEKEQEILRNRESAKRSARSFINKLEFTIPSVTETFSYMVDETSFSEEKLLLARQSIKLDSLVIYDETSNYLVLKGTKKSRIIWLYYLYSLDISPILKDLNGAVVVRKPPKAKTKKSLWEWHCNSYIDQKRDEYQQAFEKDCCRIISFKRPTKELLPEIKYLIDSYTKHDFFKQSYGSWKKYLIESNLFTPSQNMANPKFSNFFKTHKSHPYLWMFQEWHVLVLTKLAELVDCIPISKDIDEVVLFDNLSSYFNMHPRYEYLYKNTHSKFLENDLKWSIDKELIIFHVLLLFQDENVIKYGDSGLKRSGNLLSVILPKS